MKKINFEKAQVIQNKIDEIEKFKTIFGNAKYFKIETSETLDINAQSFDVNRFVEIKKYNNESQVNEELKIRNEYYNIVRKAVFDYMNKLKELKEAEFEKL